MALNFVTEPGKIRGVLVTLGSHDYIVPPLNLEGFEQHEADIEKLMTQEDKMSLRDKLRIVAGVAVTAVQRNYPEVDMVFMRKWLDVANMTEMFHAVLGQSGMRPAQPGEVTAGASIGPRSMPSSSPQPVGNGSTSPVT